MEEDCEVTRLHEDEAAQIAAASRVRARGPKSRLTGSRWGLWVCSMFVAAGAVLVVTLTGTGGAATQVPSAIQIGVPTPTSTANAVTSTIPVANSIPTTSSPPTTTSVVTRHTTVINPLSTVTDHEDPGREDGSGATTPTAATSTSTTAPSTSVDN
jgi:hypothetical protein